MGWYKLKLEPGLPSLSLAFELFGTLYVAIVGLGYKIELFTDRYINRQGIDGDAPCAGRCYYLA